MFWYFADVPGINCEGRIGRASILASTLKGVAAKHHKEIHCTAK